MNSYVIYTLLQSADNAPFTEQNVFRMFGSERGQIVDERVLADFRFWSQIHLRHSIGYDHVMLFTK